MEMSYQTSTVAIWEGQTDYWTDEAKAIYADARDSGYEPETAYYDLEQILADRLEYQFEEFAPRLDGMYADLMQSAVSQIDWRQVSFQLMPDLRDLEQYYQEEYL